MNNMTDFEKFARSEGISSLKMHDYQTAVSRSGAAALDGQYAAFGKVVEGMDVVDEIANTPTINSFFKRDFPRTPQVIRSITIEE